MTRKKVSFHEDEPREARVFQDLTEDLDDNWAR
jgi:hypothetical protein